jgi:hypothetical protein
LVLARYTTYALFLAKIYAQKAFLENTAFSTGRIVLGVYYRAYIFMDLRSDASSHDHGAYRHASAAHAALASNPTISTTTNNNTAHATASF